MARCCTFQQSPRRQRRINGLQLPLHCQQVVGWIVFLTTALLNFIVLVQIQFKELKLVSICVYCILYVIHVSSHLMAMLTDPSEKELRRMTVNTLPEFDRSIHAHVIENGRCHLCNIDTTSRKTKHCSVCNKCVDTFDHHCKWLNNCIGRRNYVPFIICVCSAVLLSLFTSSLCLTDIVLFLAYPHKLSTTAQNFVNCTSAVELTYPKFCKNSITFLTFLVIFCVSAFSIGCALLHLCCFHVYISVLGVSTYEYIVRGSPPSFACNENRAWCTVGASNYKTKSIQGEGQHCERNVNESENGSHETWLNSNNSNTINNEQSVSNFIGILINNELHRARQMLLYDKNKVHPNNESSG